jgi:membrane protease YdiL (CAAX protease family)
MTTPTQGAPPSRTPQPQDTARRGLAVYFAVLVPLSAIVTALAITQGEGWMYAAMPIPALASIVARRTLHEGFSDVGWRLRDRRVRRYIALGVALPIVICSVAYGTAWITGLTTFRPDGTAADATTVTRLLVFLTSGAVMVSINTLILVPLALGEELGWRGYMLTRLIDAGVPRPLLTSGLIWSAWHIPLVLGGVYYAGPSRIASAALLTVTLTAGAIVYGRLRLDSGSIWPAVAMHAAWNATTTSAFDAATHGHDWELWVGESGILLALTVVLTAIIYTRARPLPTRRQRATTAAPAPRTPVAHHVLHGHP